jgi:hypothetical protein
MTGLFLKLCVFIMALDRSPEKHCSLKMFQFINLKNNQEPPLGGATLDFFAFSST